jgi:hypothetical protein
MQTFEFVTAYSIFLGNVTACRLEFVTACTFKFVTVYRPLNLLLHGLHAVAKQNTASACSNKFKSLHAVTKQNTACSNKFKGLYTVTNLKVHAVTKDF